MPQSINLCIVGLFIVSFISLFHMVYYCPAIVIPEMWIKKISWILPQVCFSWTVLSLALGMALSFSSEVTMWSESEVVQWCPALCNPMGCSLPGSPVHGIFQARVREWAAISFSRGSSQHGDQTWASCIADRRFTVWATRYKCFFFMVFNHLIYSVPFQLYSGSTSCFLYIAHHSV